MKKDDKQASNEPNKKPKDDLDASAIGRAEEPIAVIDTSKYRAGLSVDEWTKLKKQDSATLTPSQKKALESADANVKQMMERVRPRLSELAKMSKSIGKVDLGSKIPKISSTIPTIPAAVPKHSELFEDTSWIDSITPPASSEEQAKQTAILERMAEAFEAQNTELNAHTQKLLKPSYIAKDHKLIFANTIIDIPIGDQELICKIMFRAGKPVSKPVGIGDALMKMGVAIEQIKGNKRVHYAKANLNITIAKKVQVNDLFEIEDKSIRFNPKYV